MRIILAFLALAFGSACAAPVVLAQEWAGWRGANRDGKLVGFQPPATWPKELEKGWQIEVGEGHATPALLDGKLYVFAHQGDEEVTLCLDASSGKELWKDHYPCDAAFMLEGHQKPHGRGPFGSPAVVDGRVFTFGIRSTLSCIDAKTGKMLWRKDFADRFPKPQAEWGTSVSPIVVDGLCVIHAGGGPGPLRSGPGKGAILAFDAATGTERWKWEGDCAGFASPILATIGGKRQLITLTESLAVGLDPKDGRLLWQVEFKTPYQQNSVTPVVLGDLVILSGTGLGTLAVRIEGEKAVPAWNTSDVSMYMSSPILKGERLFGFSEKKRGQFFCLDAKSGQVLWTGDGRQGDNAALLDAGDVILALVTGAPNRDGPSSLVVFEANDKEYKEKARYTVSDMPAWAHPVVSGRAIFIKDRTKLTRWSIP